jgi:transcriptional regulator with XRE-family HTH domain
MSDDIDTIRTELWEKMRGKPRGKGKHYRDNFVSAQISTTIAAQIQTMREARGWLQKDLGERADMSPARISVMENPSYENPSVKTLKRFASAFDVALIIRFVPFSELVSWVSSVSPEKLNAASFDDDRLTIEDALMQAVGQAGQEGVGHPNA